MDPRSGDVYLLRDELFGDAEPGDRIDMDDLRRRMREIVDATADAAASHDQLVAVSEEAARKLMLGNREQQRRRKRRKR